MFGLIKRIFIGLLTGLMNGSNHTKCVLLSDQKCMTQPTLINLHPNEYSQECHYYPFAVKLDRCAGSCNTINDLFNNVCVQNKTEDLNLRVFSNSDQWWNNNKCKCKCKKSHVCEKDYVWNPATCNCQNGKYLACIMDDSAIICDEVIDADVKLNLKDDDDETKTIPLNFNEKKATCIKQKFLYFTCIYVNYYSIIDSC